MTKAQRLQQQQDLVAAYPQAAAQLDIQNVTVRWGPGLIESADKLPTESICFRVYIQKDPADPSAVFPANIAGFPVEVVKIFQATTGPSENPKPNAPEETIKKDETEHRPLKGGISLSTKSLTKDSKAGPESGTLGWFVTRTPGNATLALTNAHVLWPNLDDSTLSNTPLKGSDPLAQPIYDTSCCCEQHVCGDRIIGIKSADVDCGIASLTAEPALIIGNRSAAEVTLRVDGSAKAAIGDKVRKIGKRSGYTEGIVIDVGDLPDGAMISAPTKPGGTHHGMTKSRVHKILVWPTTRSGFSPYFDDAAGQMAFANEGDSGSALIDEDNNIVGLIYSSDNLAADRTIGIACHIDAVMTKLNAALTVEAVTDQKYNFQIALKTSPPPGQISGIADSRLPRALTLNDLIRESDTLLGVLVRRHRAEVSQLINHFRPVTVVWHRHQGPAFAAAVNRNARERGYRVPREINGVSRPELLLALARVLTEYGSAELQEDLRGHSFELIDELSRAESVRAILFPAPAELVGNYHGD